MLDSLLPRPKGLCAVHRSTYGMMPWATFRRRCALSGVRESNQALIGRVPHRPAISMSAR